APTPAKRRRQQTWRACERCRTRRVKCDNTRPCLQCRERGVSCTNTNARGERDLKSLPLALREIEKLKLRISDLESELAECKKPLAKTTVSVSSSPSEQSDASSNIVTHHRRPPGRGWVGTYITCPRSGQRSYYGPFSAFYFLGRIGAYLSETLDQSVTDRYLYPQGVSDSLANLATLHTAQQSMNKSHAFNTAPRPMMARTQEESFLQLFWESYHCTVPIIDDIDFMQNYNSLWDANGTYRKPCPLTDIVVALSMQYGWTFLASNSSNANTLDDPFNDATSAGRWHFHRCQSLLNVDLESPSLLMIQCKIFSTTYLCNASFTNMAHATLGQTSILAHILGLHQEPPEDMPCKERELRKRVWCCLHTLETRMSLKLGRPPVLDDFHTTTQPPSEDADLGLLNSAESFAPDITWMSFTTRSESLMAVVKDIHTTLLERAARIIHEGGLQGSPYQDPQALEAYAKAVSEQIPLMQEWVGKLPTGIKMKRRGQGEAFSVDRSCFDIDVGAPLWLQRQRLFLELMYHNQMISFYRPCIAFPRTSAPAVYSPILKQHAVAALNHAIAHTDMVLQAVVETDLMNGWQECFQWQWNATITAIGFLFSNPIDPSTPAARKALEKGITIFETLGKSYSMAANGAIVVKDLMAKAELLSS
ncbi:uncharacterized protein TRIVIDRAFT_123634, partial [Trichoderma virens Gv29-8]